VEKPVAEMSAGDELRMEKARILSMITVAIARTCAFLGILLFDFFSLCDLEAVSLVWLGCSAAPPAPDFL
jgi:hypothetical protein